VGNIRARVPKDLLAGFDGRECGMSPWLLRGDSINLFGVEDGVDAMDKPGFRLPPVLFVVRAVTGGERLAVFGLGPFLPEFDLGAFLAAPDLPVVGGSLFVGHPAGVVEPFADRRRHQVDGIASPVWIVRSGVEGHGQVADRRRIPGFLPRCHTLLQHLDDGFGDLFAVITAFRDRIACGLRAGHDSVLPLVCRDGDDDIGGEFGFGVFVFKTGAGKNFAADPDQICFCVVQKRVNLHTLLPSAPNLGATYNGSGTDFWTKIFREVVEVRGGAAGHVRVEWGFSCAEARVGIVPRRRRDADLPVLKSICAPFFTGGKIRARSGPSGEASTRSA